MPPRKNHGLPHLSRWHRPTRAPESGCVLDGKPTSPTPRRGVTASLSRSAHRSDAPPTLARCRGSMERAVEAAESADSRERTEHEYENRVRAKSSAAPPLPLCGKAGWECVTRGMARVKQPFQCYHSLLDRFERWWRFSSLEDAGALAWNM